MPIQNKIRVIERKKIQDSRGWFLKIINGFENGLPPFTGEIYTTSAFPGEAKGDHYHLKANEWFILIQGKCKLKLYDIDEKEYCEINLEEKFPKTIYIPSRIAHSFDNNSNENFILIAYTDKLFEPSDTVKFNFKEI